MKASDSVVTLDVLGPVGDERLVAPLKALVRFRGFVPDLGVALSDYDALAAPIRLGSGARVKLLDAMACGSPS